MLNSITNSKIEGDEEEQIKKSHPKNLRYSNSRFSSEFISDLDKESNYTKCMIQGSNLAVNHKFKEALSQIEQCYKISQKIGDQYKTNESICHIGIISIIEGTFGAAIKLLQRSFNNYIDDMKNKTFDIGSINLLLFSKIGSNLILALFLHNKLDDCIKVMNSMIEIINQQKENLNKLNILRNIIFILFRCKSLTEQKYDYLDNKDLNQVNEIIFMNDDTIIKNAIHKIFEELNNYLKTNNLEQFFINVVKLKESLEKINDNKDLIFIIYSEFYIIF